MISMEFRGCTFKEITDNFDNLRKPLSSLEREEFKGIYPYYGAQGIIDFVKEYRCDGEYLLIAEDGENLNSRNQPIAQIANGKFWVNNHAHVIKTNEKADLKYLCYALNDLDIRGYVTGSAQPKLSQKNLNRIKFLFPNIENQKIISKILYNYDLLIDTNNKRIATLEQISFEIFKEWFTKYRYPSVKEGEFVLQTSKGWVLGEDKKEQMIPKGWKFGELGVIDEFKRGKNITSSEMVEGIVPVIAAGIEPSGYHNQANVKGCSLTISASGANAGYLAYHLEDIWAADCSYYKNDKNIWFVYNALKFLQPVISNMQVGSAQPHVYAKNINRISTIIPTNDLIEMYCDKVEPLYKEIKLLKEKNILLEKQRDSLLPRLMSGKLSVEGKEVI